MSARSIISRTLKKSTENNIIVAETIQVISVQGQTHNDPPAAIKASWWPNDWLNIGPQCRRVSAVNFKDDCSWAGSGWGGNAFVIRGSQICADSLCLPHFLQSTTLDVLFTSAHWQSRQMLETLQRMELHEYRTFSFDLPHRTMKYKD